mgnify:CR=1 FL=1
MPSGRPVATLTGHTHLVKDIAFSPDGKRLATASDDGTIRIWDTATRKTITALRDLPLLLFAVTFGTDGKLLATAGIDGARLWNVNFPADPFAAVCDLEREQMSREDWMLYLPEESYRRVCP